MSKRRGAATAAPRTRTPRAASSSAESDSFGIKRASARGSAAADAVALAIEPDGNTREREDGGDLFMAPDGASAAAPIVDFGESDGMNGVTEEGGGFPAWSVPDAVPTLRRTVDASYEGERPQPVFETVDDAPPAMELRASPRVVAIRKKSGETITIEPIAQTAVVNNAAQALDANAVRTTGVVTTPEGAAYMRPRVPAGDAEDRDRAVSMRRPLDGLDPLTQRIGTRWFADAARFDWCREGPFNLNPPGELDSRPRHTFTRWYQMDRLLVDVMPRDSERVRKEIAEKAKAIRERSAYEGIPWGYLPIVRGAFVPDEAIARAKAGEIVELQVEAVRRDVVAAFG